MISNEIFNELKPQSFAAASEHLQVGDIMLCSGEGLISDTIKKATDSVFSHVALILRLQTTQQWLVLESVESIGVRCVTLENGYVDNYKDQGKGYSGKILIARHEAMASKLAEINKLYEKAFALTGDRYNEGDIFKIASRIALKQVGIDEDGRLLGNNSYICSEYVYACLRAININLPFDSLGFIAPADIARDKAIKPVLQLAVQESKLPA